MMATMAEKTPVTREAWVVRTTGIMVMMKITMVSIHVEMTTVTMVMMATMLTLREKTMSMHVETTMVSTMMAEMMAEMSVTRANVIKNQDIEIFKKLSKVVTRKI
jgi:hypothetical protein